VTAGDSVTGYAIGNTLVDMHEGYSTSSKVAALASQTDSGATDNMGAMLWRQVYATDATAALSFNMVSVAGVATAAHFRWVGVCVRANGGTYVDTTGAQSIYDTNGYWFVLANKAGAPSQDAKWLFLRVNTGTLTLLKSVGGASPTAAVAASLTGAHEIAISVTDVGGDPLVTGYYDGAIISTAADSSGSKITAAGRCGFGMVRDRDVSGVKVGTVATYFQVTNDDAGEKQLEDDWRRVNITANPAITDGNSVTGWSLMSMWTLDIHGPDGFVSGSTQYRDAGLDRVDAQGGEYSMSQIAASSAHTQDRSITYRVT